MSDRSPLYPLTDPAAIEEALQAYDDEVLKDLYMRAIHQRLRERHPLGPGQIFYGPLWSEERPVFLAWKNRLNVERAKRSLQANQPLLYKGDRIAFSRMFLETALQTAMQHPDGRTIFVELDDVRTSQDGAKIIGIKKNICPVCTLDLDETPHDVTACPALQGPPE